MPSDFGDRRAARSGGAGGGGGYPPPAGSESLPCPRCDSTNTKFCYYNNYNLSQPRHFCKACRRYWTQGGTLRNIPVGGGTRKGSKRFRPASSGGGAAASASSSVSSPAVMMDHSGGGAGGMAAASLNDGVSGGGGGFGSLVGSGGFLALGGYGVGGLGPGSGFDEMGPYGFGGGGRGIWAFPEVGHVQENGGGGGGRGGPASTGNGWPVNGVENGMVDGECFPWPELAISMPGQGLK